MYHFRFLIVPFFFFQYRIGIIYLPISILFLEGKKEREILRAESKKGTKIREFLFCHRFRHARVQ